MFKGPKGALIFMGSVCFSVLMLVGFEDDEGALVRATDGIARDSETSERYTAPPSVSRRDPSPPPRQSWREDEPVSFADDDELIDEASGFDPSPDIEDPFEALPE